MYYVSLGGHFNTEHHYRPAYRQLRVFAPELNERTELDFIEHFGNPECVLILL